MCEIASQIFRKKYCGYGLAMPFFKYGMKILLSRSYSAAFCLPVMFHNVTQRLLYSLGLRATGMVLNVFDAEHIIHSYKNGRNRKHSQGIQVCAVGKEDAGTLYIPREHQAFCKDIYESLAVKYQMGNVETDSPKGLPGYTEFGYRNDAKQHSLEIRIHGVGADLVQCMEQIHSQYPFSGKQTANIFLNCNDVQAVWAYEILRNMGYFFTGCKPLCSDKEYMVLHHPGEVKIYFEDYETSAEFAGLTRYVKNCYEKRLLIERGNEIGKEKENRT